MFNNLAQVLIALYIVSLSGMLAHEIGIHSITTREVGKGEWESR
jgi:hypothetical protein